MTLKNRWKRHRSKVRWVLVRAGYFSRPTFLIIGAQKGGTSALYRYLAKHPRIIPARKKEVGFFHQDATYCRGKVWYGNQFPLPHNLWPADITFEATPEYLYYGKAAGRIASYDSRLRLIAVLRNPVDRAYSAWNMFRHACDGDQMEALLEHLQEGDEEIQVGIMEMFHNGSIRPFEELVRWEIGELLGPASLPEPSLVRRGLYAEQLKRYFDYFPRDQVLVVSSRVLREDTGAVLREITQFLCIPDHDWLREQFPLAHVRPYEEKMTSSVCALLRGFYDTHNQQLWDLLGEELDWE